MMHHPPPERRRRLRLARRLKPLRSQQRRSRQRLLRRLPQPRARLLQRRRRRMKHHPLPERRRRLRLARRLKPLRSQRQRSRQRLLRRLPQPRARLLQRRRRLIRSCLNHVLCWDPPFQFGQGPQLAQMLSDHNDFSDARGATEGYSARTGFVIDLCGDCLWEIWRASLLLSCFLWLLGGAQARTAS